MPLVYDELRTLASAHLRHERREHTLQTSALVNEAYLRLVDLKQTSWKNRSRFFSLASQIIRNILVDYARGQLTAKRGSGEKPLSLDEALNVPMDQPSELVALDDALHRFAALYPQQAKIVELRYFAGLTHEETAQVLDVSVATVARGWRMARAWLYRSLAAEDRA